MPPGAKPPPEDRDRPDVRLPRGGRGRRGGDRAVHARDRAAPGAGGGADEPLGPDRAARRRGPGTGRRPDLAPALTSLLQRQRVAARDASARTRDRLRPAPDGVSIAYQVFGEGPLDLVCAPGLVTHLDLHWTDPGLTRFMRRLASFARVICFDKPGTGLSDPVMHPPTLEERAQDIAVHIGALHLGAGRARRGPRVEHRRRPRCRVGTTLRQARHPSTEGRPGALDHRCAGARRRPAASGPERAGRPDPGVGPSHAPARAPHAPLDARHEPPRAARLTAANPPKAGRD